MANYKMYICAITASYIDNNCAKLKSREYFENLRKKQERESGEKLKKEKKKEEEKKELNREESNTKNQTKKETQNKPQSNKSNKTTQNTSSSIKDTVKRIFSFFSSQNKERSKVELSIRAIDPLIKTQDKNSNTIVEIIAPYSLKKIKSSLNIKTPTKDNKVKDIDGNDISVDNILPQKISKAKILSVPHIAQSVYINSKESPLGGTSMCSGASATMIADYYKKLPQRQSRLIKTDNNQKVDQDLREYVWQDKGQKLSRQCTNKEGLSINGSFAATSQGRCDQGYLSGAKEYFGKIGLDVKDLKPPRDPSFKFETIKKAINNNHPVYFGEPGHLMVAVGYLDFDKKDKKEIKVNVQRRNMHTGRIENEKDVLVKTDFILLVNDPWRNRNRFPNGRSFDLDGSDSAYLVVYDSNRLEDYMCRVDRGINNKTYTCTSAGQTALEVY